jgi:hypothetical protein
MKQQYLEYYKPLVQDFCKRMASENHELLHLLPQPFLPLFGKNYANSSLKLLIIGQDTKGWERADTFIEQELAQPGQVLEKMFELVDNRDFTEWGRNTHSFWGFAMALLAGIHGLPNWNVLKWGGHEDILSSFAWGNANAVELWESIQKHSKNLPHKTWQAAREAGAHLNRFAHMHRTMNPRVVLLTVKSINLEEFFDGYKRLIMPSPEKHIYHYRLEGHEIDIFHTYHPGYMRKVGGPWGFLNKLRRTLQETGLAPDFPEFIDASDNCDDVIKHLLASAPRPNGNHEQKFHFVEWVAKELTKHKALMSVPCLVSMANELGYRANNGGEFRAGRGSYKLVSGSYLRCANRKDQDSADMIATVFCKPNSKYAYK